MLSERRKARQESHRLQEALRHINGVGNLMPMQNITSGQINRLWDWINDHALAIMDPQSGRWSLTDAGRAALAEEGKGDV